MEMNLKYSIKLLTSHFLLLTFVIFLLTSLTTKATVRYVSKTGLSIPPYTSWEIAADSIQECINICVFGDTIYVANGVYKEKVVMIPGLSLIGAGIDSCVIDTRMLVSQLYDVSVEVAENCIFRGFDIIVSQNVNIGFGINISGNNSIVVSNRVQSATVGISAYTTGASGWISNNFIKNIQTGINSYSELVIQDNILERIQIVGIDIFNSNCNVINNYISVIGTISNSTGGIDLGAHTTDFKPFISSNFIVTKSRGIKISFGTTPTITNNTIILDGDWAVGYQGSYADSVKIFNNLVIAKLAVDGFSNSIVPTFEYNNYLTGNFKLTNFGSGAIISGWNYNVIKNNLLSYGDIGIRKEQNPVVKYNNSWRNDVNYYGFTPDSTNIEVDPMLMNDDSTQGELDFHLQMYSPLIDRGDPDITDTDFTRSDIGLYGGPYGERYIYIDIAPRPPVNLSAVYDSTSIILNWNKNTEADFSHYLIYRDVNQNFMADSTKLIAETSDTSYADMISSETDKLFYKLRAVDNQGNQSAPSEEIFVNLTSVTTNDLMTINDYRLYQNYPNPFNPSTKIGYRLKERGYVKLYVYDVKGELVSVLVNQIQEAGYYEAEFSPAGMGNQESGIESLASGIYIYQIMVRGEGDIPVFTDMKKMIFLK